MGALDNMQARATEMAGPVEDAGAPAPAAEPVVTETAAPETTTDTVEAAPEDAARAARLKLYEEKLAASREKRTAQRLEERARAERKAASQERKSAAEYAATERAKYDGLKAGSFKETIQKLGHDPAKVFAEMTREAIEASTPEAAARRQQETIDAALKAQQERIDALEAERTQERQAAQSRAHAVQMHTHFQAALADPAFTDLRIEYPDEALLDHAQYYDKHPGELRQHAASYGVKLTQPQKGFTMHELLQVLSAAQAAHNAAKQARAAAIRPTQAEPGRTPTVNGTADRRNAGTVTNELAQTRASSGPVESGSARARIRARLEQEVTKHR